MYCGNCLRDNALVATLRGMGHDVLMVPLYLPLTLDEPDQSAGTPIFFSGINVYLEQKSPFFRKTPSWFRNLLRNPRLLKWASGRAAKTRAQDVGDLTLSMLQGEHGRQARDLAELIAWLKTQPRPDVICLSNVLLIGLARRLKAELGSAVACMLQGEDSFLDALPPAYQQQCWRTVSQRAAETDLLIASSHYFARRMANRLQLPVERIRVAWNGIHLQGYAPKPPPPQPVIGYFARMCQDKGLDTLVDAFILLRRDPACGKARLHIGGSCGPSDEPFVAEQRRKLEDAGLGDAAEFRPNLSREEKIRFLNSISVFSVPARYGEAFGLYLVEAMAVGVPVVQPNTASYPEIIEASGGGILCQPENPTSLAEGLRKLLLDPPHARSLGEAGRRAATHLFSSEAMARSLIDLYQSALQPAPRVA